MHNSQSASIENTFQPFFSKIHQRNIDPSSLINFLLEETNSTIEIIRGSQLIVDFHETLVIIANGGNIWDQTNPEMEKHRCKVLHRFAAQSASQQNNERFVKATSHLKKTGKYEQKANIYGIASNGFCLEVQSDDYSQDKILTEDDIAREIHSSHRKRGVTKGQKKAMYLVKTALEKKDWML